MRAGAQWTGSMKQVGQKSFSFKSIQVWEWLFGPAVKTYATHSKCWVQCWLPCFLLIQTLGRRWWLGFSHKMGNSEWIPSFIPAYVLPLQAFWWVNLYIVSVSLSLFQVNYEFVQVIFLIRKSWLFLPRFTKKYTMFCLVKIYFSFIQKRDRERASIHNLTSQNNSKTRAETIWS